VRWFLLFLSTFPIRMQETSHIPDSSKQGRKPSRI
jgi:hypothetical protein